MSNSTIPLHPIEWIADSLIVFFVMIINILILKNECKKRKTNDIKFTTKMSEILPLLTIISAVLHSFFHSLIYFNVFCYFATQMAFSLLLELNFMGLYQLSRLYYCFAQSQAHSNKGYPNWLINSMYIFGILFIVTQPIGGWLCIKVPMNCGINKEYQYIAKYSDDQFCAAASSWFGIATFMYFLWDLTTLLLYICKVISFRKYKSNQTDVYNRIMSILNRILLLTILYEIPWILYIFAGIFSVIFPGSLFFVIFSSITLGLFSITTSYSMHLMQHHNTSEYNTFLGLSYKIGVYHICCCWLKTFVKNELKMKLKIAIENETQNKNKEDDTIWEATNISVKYQHTDIKELSIETTKQQNTKQSM